MHLSDWMERVDLRSEIQEVYLHRFMFQLAVTLVSIFLPFYLLNAGRSVSAVFLFFLVYYGVFVVMSFLNAWIATGIGFKHTSLLASPLILVFYLLLRADPAGLWLYAVAVLGGYGFNLYWMGMNPEVAESSHEQDREKETGFFFSMPALAAVISPTVGGFILASSGFNVLFLFAAILIGVSFLPFLLSEEHHDGGDVEARAFFDRAHIDDFMTYFLKGVNSIGKKVLWPLYLAIVIKEAASIGGAGSLLALGSAVTSIAVGSIANKRNSGTVLLSGVAVGAVSYLLMSQVTTAMHALTVSFINGVGLATIMIVVYSKAMSKAEAEDYVEYFAFREFALSMGRVVVLLLLLVLFGAYQLPFAAGFGVMAFTLFCIGYFGQRL